MADDEQGSSSGGNRNRVLDRIKKQRKSVRAQITRTIHEVEAGLLVDPVNKEELQDKRDKLEELQFQVNEFDQQMLDELLDNNVSEADYQLEYDGIQDYRDRIRVTRLKMLKVITVPTTVADAPPGFPVVPVDAGTLAGDKKRSFRLPEIKLRSFSGQLTEWIAFWSQFSTIHNDDGLHPAEKFHYLVQAMEPGSRAMEVVSSYPPSADNYVKAVEALRERYGRDDLLVEVYVRELLRLVINNCVSSQSRPRVSSFFDRIEAHLRALETLGVTSEKYAAMLFPLVESSLPEDTLRAWQRSGLSSDVTQSRLSNLMNFLRKEVESEERIKLARSGFSSNKERRRRSPMSRSEESEVPTAAGLFSGDGVKCIFCDGAHQSKDCGKAKKMSLSDRRKKVESRRCCYSCLRPGHTSRKCRIFTKCSVCDRKHPIILCPEVDKQQDGKKTSVATVDQSTEVVGAMNSLICTSQVMLQTLSINIFGSSGCRVVRALVDSGSHRSYIKETTAREVGLQSKGQIPLVVTLFGGTMTTNEHNIYDLEMEGLQGEERVSLRVLGNDRLCGRIPRPRREQVSLQRLHQFGIHLTDVGDGAPEVEVLLGADACGIIMTGRGHQLNEKVVAMETRLGWTIMGALTDKILEPSHAMQIVSMTITDSSWEKLWSLEILGIRDSAERMSREDEEARIRINFIQSTKRNPDGRYVVCLPWKKDNSLLRDNFEIAFKRLETTTKKLDQMRRFEEYAKIFKDWLAEGIIEVVELNSLQADKLYYLPHRPVFKPTSLTTPVRPVFDASCRTGNNMSLNELLETGPNMLELIPSVLLRFREKRFAFTSDIRKAFQMIELEEQDRNVVRLLWWDNERRNVVVYRHRRVLFGLNCSPFLLAATLEHHLSKYVSEENQAIAAKFLRSNYVDNCIASVDTREEYEEFKRKSVQVLSEAKMELRQWAETAEEVSGVGSLTNEECGLGTSSCHPQEDEARWNTNILGLTWNRLKDTLSVVVSNSVDVIEVTKRSILSQVSRFFDPIGMICPATLPPKRILQESWAKKLAWDDYVPEEEIDRYRTWLEEVPLLQQVKISRWAFKNYQEAKSVECHVFCDASSYAYATIIFARLEFEEEVAVRFLGAKNRLAPLKGLTIPRLELLACLIGVRLHEAVVSSFTDIKFNETWFWSDSSTALAWIRKVQPWKTFVHNRVTEIRSKSTPDQWHHVPGELNPADLPSRGCLPLQLLASSWWEGPMWLQQKKADWPTCQEKLDVDAEEVELRKVTSTVLTALTCPNESIEWNKLKFSSYWSIIKVFAWMKRFISNCRGKGLQGALSADEVNSAEEQIFLCVQLESFGPYYGEQYVSGIRVNYDEKGIMRVETKLLNRMDTPSFKLPALLPKNHPVVDMLIRWEHLQHGHAGAQIMMGRLREKVWILQSRRCVQKVLRDCKVCRRYTAKKSEVVPAPLPVTRVSSDAAFETTGVDLAGPLFVKDGSKAWVVIFTCATFRCVHFELVNSLSTEAFLLSLSKFISRRGRPSIVYSDNGKNFVGAVNLFATLDWKRIEREALVKRITWRFNPPSAAWWGGFWERIIRSAKDILRRMLGHKKLSYFQLESCVLEVEAILNDRPLTYVTEDESDLIPLSPSMFIRPLQSSEFPEVGTVSAEGLQQKYKSLQTLREELKGRFRREYLSLLIHRGKAAKERTFTVGEVVLVETENHKRLLWPMGKIVELVPGKDGHVRVARVKTASWELLRPLQRLFPLELKSPEELTPSPIVVTPEEGTEPPTLTELEVLKTRYGRVVKKPDRF